MIRLWHVFTNRDVCLVLITLLLVNNILRSRSLCQTLFFSLLKLFDHLFNVFVYLFLLILFSFAPRLAYLYFKRRSTSAAGSWGKSNFSLQVLVVRFHTKQRNSPIFVNFYQFFVSLDGLLMYDQWKFWICHVVHLLFNLLLNMNRKSNLGAERFPWMASISIGLHRSFSCILLVTWKYRALIVCTWNCRMANALYFHLRIEGVVHLWVLCCKHRSTDHASFFVFFNRLAVI